MYLKNRKSLWLPSELFSAVAMAIAMMRKTRIDLNCMAYSTCTENGITEFHWKSHVWTPCDDKKCQKFSPPTPYCELCVVIL